VATHVVPWQKKGEKGDGKVGNATITLEIKSKEKKDKQWPAKKRNEEHFYDIVTGPVQKVEKKKTSPQNNHKGGGQKKVRTGSQSNVK